MIKLPQITLICIDCLNPGRAQKAINKSCEGIEFGDVQLISDVGIRAKKEYSHFVINRLVDYIKTDFVLIIQYDGYVINPNLWNDDWLNYDYIGAPWWYDDYNVGNGGFSLRSYNLLSITQALQLKEYHPEDDKICRDNRRLLESEFDIKFAPIEVAEKFSFEQNPRYREFNNNTFGFHRVKNLVIP